MYIQKQQQQQQKINKKNQIAESDYLPSVVKENLKSIKRTIVWKLKKEMKQKNMQCHLVCARLYVKMQDDMRKKIFYQYCFHHDILLCNNTI